MRKAFIASGILIFLVYCWASVVWQNQVDIPGYKPIEIDLLGGRSRADWDADQQGQFQRLMDLETKNYQLPEDAGGDVDRPLTSADYQAVIGKTPGHPVLMKVRDAGAVYALLSHNYVLRDSIPDPEDPDGVRPLYFGGHSLDKATLDDLRARGFGTITVSGHAAPVNFQTGTALMIAVIFFTLVAALKPLLWEPFTAMLEKRRHELEVGSEAERQNQLEAVRFEEERRRRHAELDRRIQEIRLSGQREAAGEAAEILHEAREREKGEKMAGLRDIGRAGDVARQEVTAAVPDLALAVADALTPGKGDTRWDRMEE